MIAPNNRTGLARTMAGFDPNNANNTMGKVSTVENSERRRTGSRKVLPPSGAHPREAEDYQHYFGSP